MNLSLFLSTFALIFVAELPDKTAFAAVLMAARGRPLAVFCGSALAFTIQSAVSILFGSVLTLLPPRLVHLAAATLFLVFAILMWRRKEEEEEGAVPQEPTFLKTMWASFIVIFLAEWGDLTQLATATLVAKYGNALTIFVSATLALWASSGVAIVVGHQLKRFIKPERLKQVAAVAFALVAIWMFVSEARAGC